MKNKIIKLTFISSCLFAFYFTLTNNKLITNNIIFATELWLKKVFPALFPMFIINEMLLSLDLPFYISNIINKLFKNSKKINSYAIYVFILSIISGTPSNAFILKSLVDKKEIESKEASYMLSFTYFSNPLFLYTILSPCFNKISIIKIILIHYLSNVLIYTIFAKKIPYKDSNPKLNNNNIKISNILTKSINKSLDTTLMILGTITFYIFISSIIINCFNLTKVTETIIKGFFEVTQGLNNLSYLNVSQKLKEIIAVTIISFGGLSIHSQIQNIINTTKIKYNIFLYARIIHVIFSIIGILIF